MERVPFSSALRAQYFGHPYWLAMRYDHRENRRLRELITEPEERTMVINKCCNGFLGFCKGSPFSYDAVSRMSTLSEAAIATEIREIEYGNRPLVPGAEYTGVLHSELFIRLCRSLEPSLEVSQDKAQSFLVRTLIQDDLTAALAASWAIERLAPLLAVHFNVFAGTWCSAARIDIAKIDMVYLAEHLLTEGDHHIGMAEQMVAAHLTNGVVKTDEFEEAQQWFVDLACKELEKF